MNNEPVAWMSEFGQFIGKVQDEICHIPLYTHPVKEQKCVVKDCENHKHEGGFNGDVCSPCYQFIAHGKGTHSQAYRNAHPVKELSRMDVYELAIESGFMLSTQYGEAEHKLMPVSDGDTLVKLANAILRKAQEK